MLATLVEEPFDDPEWFFEIKWDGYRVLAEVDHDKVELYSRNQLSFNTKFPLIVDSLKKMAHQVVLDGEVILLDKSKPVFQLLQNYQTDQKGDLIYYVFDLLYLDQHDLRSLPLVQRKQLLRELIIDSAHIRYCDHVVEKGISFFHKVVKKGLEGVIAKDSTSVYASAQPLMAED